MVSARAIAETVTDPELPMLTLAELGVLRDVTEDTGRVEVTITPTYTGCPALDAMRADLRRELANAGYADVRIRTVLDPPWTTDWISDAGRSKLHEAGIAPPARRRTAHPARSPSRWARPGASAARTAARPTRSSCPGSAPPPASRCAAATPAASRSSTSRRSE